MSGFRDESEAGFSVKETGQALMTRTQAGLTRAEAFVHKHSGGPAIPIVTAVLGTLLLGPVGLFLGGALGYSGARITRAHYTAKAGGAPLGKGVALVPPTGYTHLSKEPSDKVQAAASVFLREALASKGERSLGTTKKVVQDGKGYLFRIEKHAAAPERGLKAEHLGVTVYQKA